MGDELWFSNARNLENKVKKIFWFIIIIISITIIIIIIIIVIIIIDETEFELKNQKSFAAFFCISGICIKFTIFWNKNEPHRSSISEVIDSERCAYWNA